MKVLILGGVEDDANIGYGLYKSLRSVGVDCSGYKLKLHPFEYEEQLELASLAQMVEYVKESDVVIFSQIDNLIIGCARPFLKKSVICHSGTAYRQQSELYDAYFNTFVNYTIIGEHDLWKPGAINKIFLRGPVDTGLINPVYKQRDSILNIKHSPSSEERKGTKTIQEVLDVIQKEFNDQIIIDVVNHRLPWRKNMEMIAKCDVYIDEFALYQGTKIMGTYGQSSHEAAALGKIVLCNNLWQDEYYDEYGVSCEIIAVNTPLSLYNSIKRLISMNHDEFVQRQMATRQWIERYHSMEATGLRLKQRILDNLGHLN